MVLIPSRNIASFSFEFDLKSRRNKASCEHVIYDSGFELFEIVTRVKNY
jgi:hypothetical protein